MLRTLKSASFLAATAFLVLTAASAQADTLATRIHDVAVKVCVAKVGASLPASYYAAMTDACVYRISANVTAQFQAQADARTKASTAAATSN